MMIQRHLSPKSSFDYRVLLLKRSSKSKFMPNALVFPGGVSDHQDFVSDWNSVIDCPAAAVGRLLPQDADRPKLIQQANAQGEVLDRNVAFRLNAIRETFEESGVLIAKPRQDRGRV